MDWCLIYTFIHRRSRDYLILKIRVTYIVIIDKILEAIERVRLRDT